jgi:hypothetical protein
LQKHWDFIDFWSCRVRIGRAAQEPEKNLDLECSILKLENTILKIMRKKQFFWHI